MSQTADHAIYWTTDAKERREAALFFAANISPDPAYISHGEVQTGLSIDGETWAADLDARFVEDLDNMEDGQQLAVMRDAAGALLAAAIVQWEETPRVKFGVLEDLAVPPVLRSAGLGGKLVAWVDAEAKKRGCRWMFLESGKRNHRAHAFFERHGFAEFSQVFIKRY